MAYTPPDFPAALNLLGVAPDVGDGEVVAMIQLGPREMTVWYQRLNADGSIATNGRDQPWQRIERRTYG